MKIKAQNLLRTLGDLKDTITDTMSEIEELVRLMDESKDDGPRVIRMSLADLSHKLDFDKLTLEVGDRVISPHAELGEIDWTVIGVGTDAYTTSPIRPAVTLQMTHCMEEYRQFCKPTKEYRWGHNLWGDSCLRKWLNGEFLDGFSEEDKEALKAVEKYTYRNEVEGGKVYMTFDKIFVLSASELGFTGDYIKPEGAVYPFYDGHPENRCKTDAESGDESIWWMRSPYPYYASIVRIVSTDGSLNGSNAISGFGAAAACVI